MRPTGGWVPGLVASVLSFLAGCGEPAVGTRQLAIVLGTDDAARHPYVAAIASWSPPVGPWTVWCSGTLIAPSVVMTAAHCQRGLSSTVGVSFDPVVGASPQIVTGTFIPHPQYSDASFPGKDIAVVLLDAPVASIAPALVAPIGLLDALEAAGMSSSARFDAVGYGITAWSGTAGLGTRRSTSGAYLSLSATNLKLDAAAAHGNGSASYHDSGGPHLAAGTRIVVSDTQGGSEAVDDTYRVDIEEAQAFLRGYATLPQLVPVCRPGQVDASVAVADLAAELGGGATLGECRPPGATCELVGTVVGLEGSGLVLETAGEPSLAVSAGATLFAFGDPLTCEAAYSISIAQQPANPSQTCAVVNGSGTATGAALSGAAVVCPTAKGGSGGGCSSGAGATAYCLPVLWLALRRRRPAGKAGEVDAQVD